ncbi:UNVERIFIED_CONTAM: Serine decarboxylase [Sesamum latifolium]|uniref:Serine decarboxylase n=1 Tax=Sesamum latifolium TaxID=2727402 RepID=A0AAW2X022_9LAMI
MPFGLHITRKEYVTLLPQNVDYIATLDTTISGSRNGHTPIFIWYGLSIKGYKGIQQDVIKYLMNARYLRDGLRNARIGKLEFDPEIEKIARRLQKKTKQFKGEASTSFESEVDLALDVDFEEEVMAQNPEWTIKEMTSLDLNQQPLCIEYPTLDVDFELKSGLIHLLPTFRGLAGEDPHKYLKEFHVVCSGMRPQGVT